MGIATSLKRRATALAETSPLLWYLAWSLVHRVPALLPHDQSYKAIRHFPDVDGTLLLDIGANDGISVLSFRTINPTLQILSLEPNGIHESSLRKLKARLPGVDYRMVAAGDVSSEIDLYTPVCYGVALHTATCGDRDRLLAWVESQYGRLASKMANVTHTRASVVTIDSLEVNPKIIKIDAEGFDLDIVRGAHQTIIRNRPYIILESGGPESMKGLISILDELDYGIYSFDIDTETFSLFDDQPGRAMPGHRNAFGIPREIARNLSATIEL